MKKYRGVFLKNEREIGLLRTANKMVAAILDELGKQVRPGLPTMYFEEIVQKMCREFKVKPGFQGMYGFPYALCCSVNEVIVHGFPSENVILKEGDIVTFDVGTLYQGFYGDAARTFPVGQVSEEAARLLRITEECLDLGVAQARHGHELNDIGRAVQTHAESAGFHVVRRFVGHGIGSTLHEKPEVANFVIPEKVLPLQNGMVICIEPMITVGTHEVEILEDEWSAVTKDRSLAAHFEHCVAILPGGPEILDTL